MSSRRFELPARSVPLKFGGAQFPELISACGSDAGWRFVKHFTAAVPDMAAQRDYADAINGFCSWAKKRGHSIDDLGRVTISIYLQQLAITNPHRMVVIHAAALRVLFRWFEAIGFVDANPVPIESEVVAMGRSGLAGAQKPSLRTGSIDIVAMVVGAA